MNTYIVETQKLLSDALSVPVYSDSVPEDANLPAVAWFNVGFDQERILKGVRTPSKIYQRVMIVVDKYSRGDIQTVLNELLVIDNTSNDDFQRVFTRLNNIETIQPDSPVCRVLVDLDLTAR